jgi:signal transduction histidine kinase
MNGYFAPYEAFLRLVAFSASAFPIGHLYGNPQFRAAIATSWRIKFCYDSFRGRRSMVKDRISMKTNRGNLFIVEDDPNSRKAVEALASSMKIGCETFASAEEFLERHNPSLKGCALIDFHLPGMDGLQLQKQLQTRGSSLAVVMVSAYAGVDMIVQAMKNGALDVIEKPYASDKLAVVLREALDRGDRSRKSPNRMPDDYRRQLLLCDLHDGIAQYLAVAVMLLENYRRLEKGRTEPTDLMFENALRLVKRSLEELRTLFRDTDMKDGIESILEDLKNIAAEFQDRLDIELVHNLKTVYADKNLLQEVSRMVQESLTNVWLHSRSRKARIDAKHEDGELCIDVTDWGSGFDPEKVAADRFGLLGIRKRAELFGGEVTVTSALGKGTLVSVRIPIVSPKPGTAVQA